MRADSKILIGIKLNKGKAECDIRGAAVTGIALLLFTPWLLLERKKEIQLDFTVIIRIRFTWLKKIAITVPKSSLSI
jgi:hypothetical protein